MLAAILAALLILMSYGCFVTGTPRYRGPVTDHFDGRSFHNLPATPGLGFARFLRWSWTRKPGPWLERLDAEPGPPPPKSVEGGRLRVTFVGHSTLLIQTEGLNILTDPVWSERIGPASWIGIRRRRTPGIRFEELPRIDIVLVSHNHYDHMDMPTLARLAREHSPRFFTGLGNAATLKAAGIGGASEMDWWDEAEISPGVKLAYVPARHFSSRSLCDRNRALWGGFVIAAPAGPIYFAADTGWGRHLANIRDRYGPPRLAALPIGAFLPAWFMQPMHLSPGQAIEAHRLLGSRVSIPIHYGTFRLGDDGQFEAIERLANALVSTPDLIRDFWMPDHGEGRDVPALR
ncbi:MAG: MBL fold metallo-hydrolase [Proteobacteria bacterium]|nr:MBL fold metallo-hydrolase [Pseudomonadota bacterium]